MRGKVLSVAVTADGQQIGFAQGTEYCGFTLRETTGNPCVVEIRDGSATGIVLDEVGMAASECVSDYYGEAALWCNGKIFVHLVSGTLPSGSIRTR